MKTTLIILLCATVLLWGCNATVQEWVVSCASFMNNRDLCYVKTEKAECYVSWKWWLSCNWKL